MVIGKIYIDVDDETAIRARFAGNVQLSHTCHVRPIFSQHRSSFFSSLPLAFFLVINKLISLDMHIIRTRALVASLRAARPTARIPSAVLRSTVGATAQFHASTYRRSEIKSPFQTFVDVLKEEIQKNRELQQNVKQLQGDVDKLQDSEAMKRAREMYERARVGMIRLLHTEPQRND